MHMATTRQYLHVVRGLTEDKGIRYHAMKTYGGMKDSSTHS